LPQQGSTAHPAITLLEQGLADATPCPAHARPCPAGLLWQWSVVSCRSPLSAPLDLARSLHCLGKKVVSNSQSSSAALWTIAFWTCMPASYRRHPKPVNSTS